MEGAVANTANAANNEAIARVFREPSIDCIVTLLLLNVFAVDDQIHWPYMQPDAGGYESRATLDHVSRAAHAQICCLNPEKTLHSDNPVPAPACVTAWEQHSTLPGSVHTTLRGNYKQPRGLQH